jgi:hypothetical protein
MFLWPDLKITQPRTRFRYLAAWFNNFPYTGRIHANPKLPNAWSRGWFLKAVYHPLLAPESVLNDYA